MEEESIDMEIEPQDILFQLPEILERIFKFVDDSGLRELRGMCTLWEKEARKILIKREKKKESVKIVARPCSRIQHLYDLLKDSEMPQLLFSGHQQIINYSSYLNDPIVLAFLREYGSQLKHLQVNLDGQFCPEKLFSIFALVPNMETLLLHYINPEVKDCDDPNIIATYPCTLSKLNSFTFTFTAKSREEIPFLIFQNIYAKITQSTEVVMKYIEISDGRLHMFLDLITPDFVRPAERTWFHDFTLDDGNTFPQYCVTMKREERCEIITEHFIIP